MSESDQHYKLVKMIIRDVSEIVGSDYCCFIESDMADGRPLPQLTLEGFRPDVSYQYRDVMIIGEAKTSRDVERPHSIKQYESYIKRCFLFDGNATFIMAVPWTEYATACNIIQKIKKKYPGDYSVKIIKGIGV